jgi:hypothetical protein
MGKAIALLAAAAVTTTAVVIVKKKKEKEKNSIIEVRKCKKCDTQLPFDSKGKFCVDCKAEQSE